MESYTFVLLTTTLLVATSNAAPKGTGQVELKIPDACTGKAFCSIKPKGYDKIENIINNLLPPHLIAQNVGDRLGDATPTTILSPESDWHNCPYIKSTEEWYTHNDSNTEMDIIVQTKLFRQPVEIINCAYDKIKSLGSQECFQDVLLQSSVTKSSCQTTRNTRRLFIYDSVAEKIKQKDFEVPCCCSCTITESI